jgi:hypothetical protein
MSKTRITAKLIPWSSVVGCSVMVEDSDTGEAICLLAVTGGSAYPSKESCEELARQVAEKLNRDPVVYPEWRRTPQASSSL